MSAGNHQLPANFGTGQNDPIPFGQQYGKIRYNNYAANHFGNRSGPFSSHQFGRNNPNSKRNLALMKTYQKNMQVQSQQSQQAPPRVMQLINAINCVYSNGCFGQGPYSTQLYNNLMRILNNLPPNAVTTLSTLQSAVQNNLYLLQNSNYQFLFSNAGALWANIPPNQQTAIISGINCGYANQCISPSIYSMLQQLLTILYSYSGPSQTASSVLTSDYNTCMANAPNTSVCEYFTDAKNAVSNGYNSWYMGEYGLNT